MLKIGSTKEVLTMYLNSFVWTFKIGDNVLWNLDVIFHLIEDHNKLGRNYAKPISISCISVVEAALVDFLERLDSATNHYPANLNAQKIDIKKFLNKEKSEFQTTYEGKVYKFKRLKNFGYKELISFYETFHILGFREETYLTLQDLGRFRNRVHIRNYFGNFERNESRTFSENRTQRAIDFMEATLKYLSVNYPRP